METADISSSTTQYLFILCVDIHVLKHEVTFEARHKKYQILAHMSSPPWLLGTSIKNSIFWATYRRFSGFQNVLINTNFFRRFWIGVNPPPFYLLTWDLSLYLFVYLDLGIRKTLLKNGNPDPVWISGYRFDSRNRDKTKLFRLNYTFSCLNF